MSSWKAETAADLSGAITQLTGALGGVKGEPTDLQLDSIWRAYLLLEKSVVFIKLELGDESPGKIVKMRPYQVPDERQAIQFALRNLSKGSEEFRLGNFSRALESLRESRNYLRVLLRQKKLERRRKTPA